MEHLPKGVTVSMQDFSYDSHKKGRSTVLMLRVTISGMPTIGEIAALMKQIRLVTSNIKGDYISVTDLTKLEVNKIFESFILFGMEKSYKIFLSVKNQAIMSFVILGKKDNNRFMSDTLKRINNDKVKENYAYQYFFLEDESRVSELVEKGLK